MIYVACTVSHRRTQPVLDKGASWLDGSLGQSARLTAALLVAVNIGLLELVGSGAFSFFSLPLRSHSELGGYRHLNQSTPLRLCDQGRCWIGICRPKLILTVVAVDRIGLLIVYNR